MIALCTILIVAVLLGPDAAAATDVYETFVGGTLPAAPGLPFEAPVEAMAGPRMLDSTLVLALIGIIVGIGRIVVGSWKDARPLIAASVVLGVLMWTVVNPAFWEVEKVVANEAGVTVVHYQGEDPQIAWADIKDVRIDDGSFFPFFTDDRALVLLTAEGQSVSVPRFVTGAEQVAAAISAKRP